MSRDPATAAAEAEGRADHESPLPWMLRAAPNALDRETTVLAAGSAALLTAGVGATLRVVRNLPYEPVAVPSTVRTAVVAGTPLVLAIALVAVALASVRPAARVGLLFAGVFGVLAAVDTAATLPAVVALIAGGGLAVLGAPGRLHSGTPGRPITTWDVRRRVIATAFVVGIAVSLAAAVGVLGGGARDVGSFLVLGAIAGTGLRAGNDRVALVAGALAFVAVAAASTANPYVAGSALLVGFAVVGSPHLLVGVAVAGGVAAAVTGLRRREYGLAIGAGLLLFAGMPATLPRATAVLLGVTLAMVGSETLVTPPDATSSEPEVSP